MSIYLLIFSIIVITCVFLNKFSGRVGIPVLLLFLILGLLCGSGYDSFADKEGWLVGDISTIALIFIMFYGGFGTRWKSARPVIVESGLLATVGVVLTAAFVGLFCHFAMKWGWVESFLMGSVIASTDAATVFSILRTKKLGLKNNSAPLLEVESGSNDPMSFMLTSVLLSMMAGGITAGNVIWQVFAQIVFGAGAGLVLATGAILLLKSIKLKGNGFDLLIFVSLALVSYAVPDLIGGNGYLSAYIVGIVLGNTQFEGKKQLVSLFDTITSLMQITIFFLLGMMAIPGNLLQAIVPALIIFAVLTVIARPLAVCGVLIPFKKYPASQLALVSFAGLRGAASIVFAIMILNSPAAFEHDIFSIVFCIVIISIGVQGSLIPAMSRWTGMTDSDSDVMTTFNDFKESAEMSFGSIHVSDSGRWNGRAIKDLDLPEGCLIVLIIREGKQIIPHGDTTIMTGDHLVICSPSFDDDEAERLTQHILSPGSKWVGHKVREFPKSGNNLLVMIKRGDERIVPNGDTILENGDILVLLKRT